MEFSTFFKSKSTFTVVFILSFISSEGLKELKTIQFLQT